MSKEESLQFTCQHCRANELSYHQYAKCIMPAKLQNGRIEYRQSIVDEDDSLATLNGFACRSCGRMIEHCGVRLQTEKELLDYLRMEPFDRLHQQQEYQELLDAQIHAQEQKEKEQDVTAATVDIMVTDLAGAGAVECQPQQ